MNALINYLIEVNLGLVLFFILYYFLLRSETDFSGRRICLLGAIGSSLIFPLVSIANLTPASIIPSISYFLPELIIGAESVNPAISQGHGDPSISFEGILLAAYSLITVLLFSRVLSEMFRLLRLSKKYSGHFVGNYFIIESTDKLPSFSFFKTIVVGQCSQLSQKEKEHILRHELVHCRLYHSADVMLTTLLSVFFWVNPVVWLYKKEFTQIHEFEADALSTSEASIQEYCDLVARIALVDSGYPLARHFNKSLTLKRIEMMKASKKQMPHWKSTILGASIILFFVVVACQDQVVSELKKSTLTQVSEFPPAVAADAEKIRSKITFALSNLPRVSAEGPVSEAKSLSEIVVTGMVASSDQPMEISYSQTVEGGRSTIRGKVVRQDGTPLAGANIIILGTTHGTVSSSDGSFEIKPGPEKGQLAISFIGYKSKVISF